MLLRIGFEVRQSERDDHEVLIRYQQHRQSQRLRDAGRAAATDSPTLAAIGDPVAIGERLGPSLRLVVLGDPGGGKSTMMRWLATAYLQRHPDALSPLLGNETGEEAGCTEALVLLALFGREDRLHQLLADGQIPVQRRQRTLEALALIASRNATCGWSGLPWRAMGSTRPGGTRRHCCRDWSAI